MKIVNFYFILAIIFFSTILGCSKDKKQDDINEVRKITTLKVKVELVDVNHCYISYSIDKSDTTGLVEFGIVWSDKENPVVGGLQLSDNSLLERKYYVEKLNCCTQYFTRAFVKTSDGEIIYSDNVGFVTKEDDRFNSFKFLKGQKVDSTILKVSIYDNTTFKSKLNFLNKLVLPKGLYLYAKFNDTKGNLKAIINTRTKLCADGDTIHLNTYNPADPDANWFYVERIFTKHPTEPSLDWFSAGKISICLGGTVQETAPDYNCKYLITNHPLNTIHYYIFESDTVIKCPFN